MTEICLFKCHKRLIFNLLIWRLSRDHQLLDDKLDAITLLNPIYLIRNRFSHICWYVFVCNPLIIAVKALIYKLSVRSMQIQAYPLITEYLTHFLKRWADNHQIKRGRLDSPKQTPSCFLKNSVIRLMAAFPSSQLQQLFPRLFPRHIRGRFTLPGFLFHIIFPNHFLLWQLQSHPSSLWKAWEWKRLADINIAIRGVVWM